MRAALLAALLLATPLVGTTAGEPATQNHVTATVEADGNETALLSKDELLATVVDEDRWEYDASLYYVAANGTWYRADRNGTIGQRDPEGDTVPDLDTQLDNGTVVDETISLPDVRPLYVWKVTNECGASAYDATNGSLVFDIDIPGCRVLETSTGQPNGTTNGTELPGVVGTAGSASPSETATVPTTSGNGAGFGLGGVIVALAGSVGYLLARE